MGCWNKRAVRNDPTLSFVTRFVLYSCALWAWFARRLLLSGPLSRRESLPTAARCCQVLAFCRAPPFTPGQPSSCNPSHPPYLPRCPWRTKSQKSQKALCHGISHAMDHGCYRAAPLPRHCTVSYSHTVGKSERPIVPHARESPRLPLLSTSGTSESRAANQHPGAQSGRPIANVIRLCQTAPAHLNSDTDHHGVLETHQALKPSFIRPWEAVWSPNRLSPSRHIGTINAGKSTTDRPSPPYLCITLPRALGGGLAAATFRAAINRGRGPDGPDSRLQRAIPRSPSFSMLSPCQPSSQTSAKAVLCWSWARLGHPSERSLFDILALHRFDVPDGLLGGLVLLPILRLLNSAAVLYDAHRNRHNGHHFGCPLNQ